MVECELCLYQWELLYPQSFNRYMVECEYQFLLKSKHHYLVLIDTWWNVNHYEHEIIYSQYVVLIDTWWNVNINVEEPPEWLVSFY